MRQFLIVYDKRRHELVSLKEYASSEQAAALAEYSAVEEGYEGDPGIQVVLLGADSIETVKVTHANFFGERRPQDIVDDLSDEVRAAQPA